MRKLRHLNPALVIALIALFVSLSGTAFATGMVPAAKRALFANNAGKLRGKTPRQIANIPGPATDLEGMDSEDIAALPGPASTASSLVSVTSAPFALAPNEDRNFSAQCPEGAKAVSGGFTSQNEVLSAYTYPTDDGSGWTLHLVNISGGSATGNVQAVCLG